ncbi:uncharacterized protein N7483_005545 [Penicillium malachiteum]|uniref:uncharacterized protein n=1 Tax=Penicillium malachiteum TaxID=1324776 RepID=UPI0025470C53|nr:uncharacterized protein N7483_005545 [Penicillium malachiteum]KAJ5731037.1 hypothetical protein N7483_005545 [Penicillium malachiteum]
MSIVQENACALNIKLDLLQQQISLPERRFDAAEVPGHHVRQLQNVINSISVTSKTQSLLSAARLVEILSDPILGSERLGSSEVISEQHVSDHLWLVAAKATVQASGLVMHSLLERTLQLQEEIYYWDEVLGSGWLTGLYAAQTSPTRLWHWSRDIYADHRSQGVFSTAVSRSFVAGWAQFYQVARQSLQGTSEHPNVWKWSSPIRLCRSEIQRKRDRLVAVKDLHASSLGLLMEGWHAFRPEDTAVQLNTSPEEWRATVSKTVHLTEAILQHVASQSNTAKFEQSVFQAVENDNTRVLMQGSLPSPAHLPMELIQRLNHVLLEGLPVHEFSVSTFMSHEGRPSRVVRYWLPLSVALFSGSLSLNILFRRRYDITQWIMNIGSTIIDFGSNWVVEPIHKLIGTIRHDEKSEIAIMSKNSLLADRASLERMVVDFVRDRPDPSWGSAGDDDAAAIVNAVKEGDLTPVLKAYERDLRSPFKGTVRGDLVRALLIQIQKTKVDVEIAISGINSLLKSQELVFGFIGLTPGILVSYTSIQWLVGLFGDRRGLRQGKKRHELKRGLRHATRILTSASLSNGVISYKDSGRLICEAEALLQQFKAILGRVQYREFREDIEDLLDIQGGVDKQLQVVERIRWTYFH